MRANDPFDASLRAAFGPRSEVPRFPTVLESVTAAGGSAPRVLLQDGPDGGPTPVLKTNSGETDVRPLARNNYRILGEIAAGGMGVVLRGHDADLGRDVALKVLRKEHGKKPAVLDRFLEEAQIGGQLQHPGIVPIYEIGLMSDDRPFFAMKLVKGSTLSTLLAERSSPDEDRHRFLALFQQVCQTVAYAHSRHVIHRDLKSDNVMIGPFGEVQVVDWGLAKVLSRGDAGQPHGEVSVIETVRSGPDSSGTASLMGSVMGTPAYMPPEQARGQVDALDERSDVFSLGAILLEILTGEPPYPQGGREAVDHAAEARLDDALARLDASGADGELVHLARHCLEADPAARPRNGSVLSQEIEAWFASAEERKRAAELAATEARVRAAEERKARKLTLALAVSLLATVLVGGGGWLWLRGLSAQRARATASQVDDTLAKARRLRDAGEWEAALSAARRAEAYVEAGEADAALHAHVASWLTEIEGGASAARSREENEAFLAALEAVRLPEVEAKYDGYGPSDWALVDSAYAAIFARHGLEPGAGSEEAAAAAIAASSIRDALAVALDEWAEVRELASDPEGSARLHRVARLADPDPTRRRLRDALSEGRADDLLRFAATEDLRTLSPATLNLLGRALLGVDRTEDAIEVYRAAQWRHPDDFILAVNLAGALRSVEPKRLEEAARYYMAAAALRPDNIPVRDALATALNDLGEKELAAQILREAMALNPQDARLHLHLGWIHWDEGELPAAVEQFQLVLAIRPGSGPAFAAYDLLDSGLRALGRYDEAYQVRRQELDFRPDNFGAIHGVAWYLATAPDLAQRNPEEALRHARAYLEVEPDRSAVWALLGTALYRTGEWQESRDALARAIELHRGEMPDASAFLAMAEYRLGRPDAARSWLAVAERRLAEVRRVLAEGQPQGGWRLVTHLSASEELARLVAEARALMGDG